MASKKDAGSALKTFCYEFGVPDELTIDGSKEQNSPRTLFMKACRKYDIRVTRTEPERPNENPAEGVIREMRRKWFRIAIRKMAGCFAQSRGTYVILDFNAKRDSHIPYYCAKSHKLGEAD